MADQDQGDERERLRQERIEGERGDAGANRNRLIVGYSVAAVAGRSPWRRW